MHIFLHDYAGHPFQAELSRALAGRGHIVTHAYFAADPGPKGALTRKSGDPPGLSFVPLGRTIPYSKTDLVARRRGDIAYGREVALAVAESGADMVISGNTPTEAQEGVIDAAEQCGMPFIYWCQDFYSLAVSRLLARKLPGLGAAVGGWYRRLERRQMQRAAKVILITDGFRAQTDRWGIPAGKVAVIPNWGAIDALPFRDRATAWATEHGLSEAPRYVYSGTLALKHNPDLLAALARRVDAGEQVVVVAAGVGADRLAALKTEEQLDALRLLPLQPFDRLGEVLATADILLAVIEREAGAFSVPSKILSYLCAGRPIVLAAPDDNLAARIIRETGAGSVVAPEDTDGFVAAARRFAHDPVAAAKAGAAGRRYAEHNFPLDRVADRFEVLFADVARREAA